MALNITPTFEFDSLCIACLSENIVGVRSKPELAKIYEELIQEQITEKLNENSYIFCVTCENHIRNFNVFRENCKESWKKLAKHFTDEWASELEQLLSGTNGTSEKQENIKENGSTLPNDEIFMVDSDSEASTIPPDPEDLEQDFLQQVDATTKSGAEFDFIDITEMSNELKDTTNGDSVLSLNTSNSSNSDQNIDNNYSDRERELISLGLLPKAKFSYLNICNVCHINTNDIYDHYITAHTTTEQNKYICSGCTQVCKSRFQIVKHIKSCHTMYLKPRKCAYCNDTFIESGEYHHHMFIHQNRDTDEVCVCSICGKFENNQECLKSHVLRMHNGCLHCKFCYKAFLDDQNDEYLMHMEMEEKKRFITKTPPQIFVCDVCGYKTRYKQQLKLHVQNLHKIPKERLLPCIICEKKFSSSENLRHHMKYNHSKKYKCTDCDRLFGFLKDMRLHYQRDHTEDGLREACDICGKILSKQSMNLHKSTIHSDLKPFQCNVCDKAFKQKVMLKTHMYKHTGFRPYFCSICDRGFYDSPILEKHFLREHGKKLSKEDIKRDCRRKSIVKEHF